MEAQKEVITRIYPKVKFTLGQNGELNFESDNPQEVQEVLTQLLDSSQYRVQIHQRQKEVETQLTHRVKMITESNGQSEFMLFVLVALSIIGLSGFGIGQALKPQNQNNCTVGENTQNVRQLVSSVHIY
jgi:hypothetical protein